MEVSRFYREFTSFYMAERQGLFAVLDDLGRLVGKA
jgi:hypothetical protein